MISSLPALADTLDSGRLDSFFAELYGADEIAAQKQRYSRLLKLLGEKTVARPALFVNGPGRTELGGNHTDHNHGCVLAAAVNLDCVAAITPVERPEVVLWSEDYQKPIKVDLTNLQPQPEERDTAESLVRGVAAAFYKSTGICRGFHGYLDATCKVGTGLSSSAAFSVLIGAAFNYLYDHGRLSSRTLALMAQEAEIDYFGKPCGLMDQMASATGKTVFIDFNEPTSPVVKKIDLSLAETGYTLALVDTGGSHVGLTSEYAAINQEMCGAAGIFGQPVGRGITIEMFFDRLPEIREQVGDRAALRLLHFIEENNRVQDMAELLAGGAFSDYLQLVRLSGESSIHLLQNCSTVTSSRQQGILLALALSNRICPGAVARVHGGGFAGTIQAYIPTGELGKYKKGMENIFGEGSVLEVRLGRPGVCALDSSGLLLPEEH
jgi:galactokinase